MLVCFFVFMLLFYIYIGCDHKENVTRNSVWISVPRLQSYLKHQIMRNFGTSFFTLIPVVSFLFVIAAEVSVASSSGVQTAHQGLFTRWCLWGVSEEAARERGLSISLIYERPYWACYARAKTGRDPLGTKSHLRVDCVMEKRGGPITNPNSIKSHAGWH